MCRDMSCGFFFKNLSKPRVWNRRTYSTVEQMGPLQLESMPLLHGGVDANHSGPTFQQIFVKIFRLGKKSIE